MKNIKTKSNKSTSANIGFKDAIRMFYQKYFQFNGASTRAEYWWVVLYLVCASLVLALVAGIFSVLGALGVFVGSALLIVFGLANIIPGIALMSRRIHDAGFSAWIFFAPQIVVTILEWLKLPFGGILSTLMGIFGLVLTLLPSKTQGNPYRE